MDYQTLKDEIINDPLGRGYAQMSDVEVAQDLTTEYRTYERTSISGAEIFNAIDPAEFSALSDSQKTLVRDVFSLGVNIDVSQGTNARAVLVDAFPSGTTTLENLAGLVNATRSRAAELGLGRVDWRDVRYARTL